MASFSNISESDSASEGLVTTPGLRTTTVVARTSYGRPASTLSPGHAAILEMHANSQTNALIYIAVVLGLYIFGITIVIIKYIRGERYEARLTRLFHNLMNRDTFFRLSRRHSGQPKPTPTPDPSNIEEPEATVSPAVQIPEIRVRQDIENESKV